VPEPQGRRPAEAYSPGSTAGAHQVIVAAKIDEAIGIIGVPQRHHATEQDVMRANIGDVDDLAIEGDRTVREHRRASLERGPGGGGKSFLGRKLAAEQLRQLLMSRRQHVYAHDAVRSHARIGRRTAVDAQQGVGGSSVTLQTAEAVKPARPALPSVVTILTAVPRHAMASRYSRLATFLASVSARNLVIERKLTRYLRQDECTCGNMCWLRPFVLDVA
jgi:hypothetical protein